MISALFSGLSWKLAGLVAALLASGFLWLWIGQLRAENAELRRESARLHSDVALYRAVIAERDKAIAAFAEAERQAEARRREAEAKREELRHAPDVEDGRIAPVLRRALQRMR